MHSKGSRLKYYQTALITNDCVLVVFASTTVFLQTVSSVNLGHFVYSLKMES